jgi:CRP/FNR family cyclic AMP-dependent transcriptional regulator
LVEMTAASALRSVPLFAQLRDSDLGFLTGLLRPRDFAKNRVILFAHDASDAFYVVLSGQVKVMMIAEDGREVVLSLVGQGDFFGETALLDDEPFAASVIAVEDSSLLVLHRDDFRRCIKEMPEMAFGLLRALCSRLREADHKIGGLMLLDVTGRIAHLLLDIAARVDGDQFLEVPTHQVIAQMVGSSRETVSRTITLLASRGWIETSPDGIRIMNRKELESAAGHLLRRRLKTPPFAKERRSQAPA